VGIETSPASAEEREDKVQAGLFGTLRSTRESEVGPMKPTVGQRTWFKVFVNDWLEGTTRYQMSDAQRAFWIDLLAMAGRSRFGGIVCSGKDGEQLIGYPLSKFQGLLAEPLDVEATFALFERTGKITLEVSGEGSRKLYVLHVTNWAKYQSEYDRTKQYRRKSATPNATELLQAKSQSRYAKSNRTEVEVDGEVEVNKNHSANPSGPHDYVALETPKTPDENFLAVKRVWDYYIEKLAKNPKILTFTTVRRQKGLTRLRECLEKTGGDLVKAEALLRCAIDALAASAWHMGENPGKKKYDSWEKNLFKGQEQLEYWLERA
jgi:hypothetical protein